MSLSIKNIPYVFVVTALMFSTQGYPSKGQKIMEEPQEKIIKSQKKPTVSKGFNQEDLEKETKQNETNKEGYCDTDLVQHALAQPLDKRPWFLFFGDFPDLKKEVDFD